MRDRDTNASKAWHRSRWWAVLPDLADPPLFDPLPREHDCRLISYLALTHSLLLVSRRITHTTCRVPCLVYVAQGYYRQQGTGNKGWAEFSVNCSVKGV